MNPLKRSGLGLLGLCVLALGLMAFNATAAQAEGTWMVKGAKLTSGSKALTGKLVSPGGKLLATLGLNKTVFGCTAGALVNANLEAEGAISEASKNAKVKFSGCTTEINAKLATACEPVNGTEKGVIVTEEGYALLKEHETGETITEIVPKTGTVFAILHLSKTCAIGEEVKVFGKLAVKDSGGNKGLVEEKAIHTIEEFPALTELKVANSESESKATLDGKAEAELSSGEVWAAVMPGLGIVTTPGGNNKNPFMLRAEVIQIIPANAGVTCAVPITYEPLEVCEAAAGSTVVWLAL